MKKQLPIDVIPGTNPPRFRWRLKVDTIAGPKVVESEGLVLPSIESALVELISMVKKLQLENAVLRQAEKQQRESVSAPVAPANRGQTNRRRQ